MGNPLRRSSWWPFGRRQTNTTEAAPVRFVPREEYDRIQAQNARDRATTATQSPEGGVPVERTTNTGSHQTVNEGSSAPRKALGVILGLLALLAVIVLLVWGLPKLFNTNDDTPVSPVETTAPADPSTTPPPGEDETSEPVATSTPVNEGTNGTRVTEDPSVRDLLERNGYRAADGWTTDVNERAFDDIADNNPGLGVVGTSFATTPE